MILVYWFLYWLKLVYYIGYVIAKPISNQYHTNTMVDMIFYHHHLNNYCLMCF